MYRVSVRQHFDAAHYLRNYHGKCEQMHGHRFEAVATVTAAELDQAGMALDFSDLKKHLWEIVERFDHVSLNDVPPFDSLNPTSENIAATIYREMADRLAGLPVSLYSVEVWESPDSWATYMP